MSDIDNNVNKKRLTQCEQLIRHFRAGKSITAREADSYPFFITQFHTRKSELEQLGFVFRWEWEKNKTTNSRYKRYWLVKVSV